MKNILRFLKLASLAAGLIVLASCGGGGGKGSPAGNSAPTGTNLVEVSSLAVGALSASWLPASDDTTPAASIRYQIHASTDASFIPGAATLKFEGTGVSSANITSGLTPGSR